MSIFLLGLIAGAYWCYNQSARETRDFLLYFVFPVVSVTAGIAGLAVLSPMAACMLVLIMFIK